MHGAFSRRNKKKSNEILLREGGKPLMRKEPTKKRRKEKLQTFSVGDLVKIKNNAHFVEEEFIGAAGLVVAFNKTGYPKGFSGRAKDDIMYVVAACGKNIKLFEDEMEMIC